MNCSNLRNTLIIVTKNSPKTIELPEGYMAIIHSYKSWWTLKFDSTDIKIADKDPVKIELINPGTYTVTILKAGEIFEFNKLIKFKPTDFKIKSSSKSVLLIVKGTLTYATFLASSVYKNYSEGDIGLITELNNAIDRIVDRVNEAMAECSDKNIEKAEQIIQKSIGDVCNNYGLASTRIEFITFD